MGNESFLAPVRRQLSRLIPFGSSVLDLGCGRGEQLFMLRQRITYGLGVDANTYAIATASRRHNHERIDYVASDLFSFCPARTFDVSLMSFVLHTLSQDKRTAALQLGLTYAPLLLVADYSPRLSGSKKLLVHIDELLAGHHEHFVSYRRHSFLDEVSATTIKPISCLQGENTYYDVWLFGRK